MKLVTYVHPETLQARPGALIRFSASESARESVLDLEAAYRWAQRGASPASLLELIQAGPAAWEVARQALAEAAGAGETQRPGSHARETVRLLSPIQPVSLRDAYAFEQHVRKANENRGRLVPEEWYRFPIFYYTNHNTVIGPDAPLACPRYTAALDYELEIAAVVGLGGKNLSATAAADHIFGVTVFNDWSARDIQRAEMKAGLGPAKGKDFASSLGPCIVTLDELADRAVGRPGVYDLSMTAAVNGEQRSAGNFKDIFWSFGEILARVSEEVQIHPGEVIGSGTVGTGCLLELTKAEGPWLQAGDVVELEIERIGILRNQIIQP
ncbi:MAG: fumarylacetoacetase [Chloroflexi bacterium HGW-Chloroflexi-6]|nr:MAG: fumarylacetoacetase [Chloroflexi bacterium HGW-Chloroflexi-6]